VKLQLFEYLKGGSTHLSLKDIQKFILSVYDEEKIPNWIQLKNKSKIEKFIIILTPGLDYDLYNRHTDRLDIFKKLGCHACLTHSVSCDSNSATVYLFNALLNVPKKIKKNHMQTPIMNVLEMVESQNNQKKHSIEEFLLSEKELEENEFPLFLQEDYIETQILENKPYELISMDCEMCLTEKGSELTRITLVAHHLKEDFSFEDEIVLDEFVLPKSKIVDYLTQYSGITEEHLKDVTTTLKDVQQKILKIVSSETILIGHSLENDLKSAKILHSKIIDTSVLYPMKVGQNIPNRKFSLKSLAIKYLKKSIQKGTNGHDSIEDAKTSFELFLLKLRNGPLFGLPTSANFENFFNLLEGSGKKSIMIDDVPILNRFATTTISTIPCVSDEEIVQKSVKEISKGKNDFILVRLQELTKESKNEIKTIENLNSNLTSMLNELPKHSLFCVLSGFGNLQKVEEMKLKFGDGSNQMNEAIQEAKNAITFIGTKK
jgi:RNA exonuclease 1